MERFRRRDLDTTLWPTFSTYQWTKASKCTASTWSSQVLWRCVRFPVMKSQAFSTSSQGTTKMLKTRASARSSSLLPKPPD